jgi:hypothetical protein
MRLVLSGTLTVAVMATALGPACGCYRHVVRADSASPGRYQIYEPNLAGDVAPPGRDPRVKDEKRPSKMVPTKPAKP